MAHWNQQPPAGFTPLSVISLSIILPTYNRGPSILESIGSVLSQTYSDFELVVVDDCSTDDTESIVSRSELGADKRLRYLRLPRRGGAGAARNAGIRSSSGTLLAFQDSDDVWMPEKLERQLAVLETAPPEVAVIYGDMLRVYPDGRKEYHTSPELSGPALVSRNNYAVYGIGIQSALIRREAIEAVGGFDESLRAFEDMELFIRLSRRYAFRRVPEPLVLYRRGGEQVSRNRAGVLAARRKIFDTYYHEIKRQPFFFVREFCRCKLQHVPH